MGTLANSVESRIEAEGRATTKPSWEFPSILSMRDETDFLKKYHLLYCDWDDYVQNTFRKNWNNKEKIEITVYEYEEKESLSGRLAAKNQYLEELIKRACENEVVKEVIENLAKMAADY